MKIRLLKKLFGSLHRRIDLVAVDDIFLPEELRGDIQEHVDACYEIFVPAQVLRQPVTEDGGGRREDGIVSRDKQHRPRDIGRAAEGKLPVQREVPEHAQNQRDKIRRPIRPVQQLVQEGETADFDEARAGREEHELQESPGLVHGVPVQLDKVRKKALAFPRLFCIFESENP